MVQAVINIDENTNRVLNIVKAKFGLKDKSQAINLVVSDYEKNSLEPELKPQYIEKINNIEKKGKFTNYNNISRLRKEIENA